MFDTEYITVIQAARALGRAPGSIYSRLESGSLKSVRIDGRLMVRAADIQREIDETCAVLLRELTLEGLIDFSPPPG